MKLRTVLLLVGSVVLPACAPDTFWVETVTPATTSTTTSTTTTAPRRAKATTTTSARRAATTTSTSPSTTTSGPASSSTTATTQAVPAETALVAAPPPANTAAYTAPLTGLPMDPDAVRRPVIVVKIDNAPKARPQVGLNEADVVFEEGVEGGITRFAALFHSRASQPVGPVRSARSTDIAIVSALNHPLFAYSGANEVFRRYVAEAPLVDVGVDNHPDRYHRDSGRPSPNNLFSATPHLLDLAPEGSKGPPPLFSYRPSGAAADAAPGSRPVSKVQAQWKASKETMAVWEWDPLTGGWRRTQNGEAHVDAAGRQVAPPNVILQFVPYRDTGLVDSSGTSVPEAEVVGEGEAWVLTGGTLIPVTWSKRDAGEITRYVDGHGREVRLAPGQTWVELVPPGQGTVVF